MAKPPLRAQELAGSLASQIRSGQIQSGAWLPSERQLAETHGVSRSTARAAIQIVATLGHVRLVQGSGAQVVTAEPSNPADDDLHEQLGAIREQLLEITARLSAVEARTGIGPDE